MLSLAEALKTGRLQEFIEQAERDGVGPADRKALEAAIGVAATKRLPVKKQRPKDRTSRSASRGDLRGT